VSRPVRPTLVFSPNGARFDSPGRSAAQAWDPERPNELARRAPAGRDNVPPRRPVPFLSRPIRRKCPDRTTGLHNPLIAINLSRTLRFRAIWTGDPRGGTTFGRPPYIKCESPVPPGMKFLTGWESWLSTDSSRHRPRAPRPRGQIVSFHSAAVSRFHQARVSTLLETTAEVFSGADLSLHLFKIRRFPAAVEGRPLRAVDAEVDEPAFARSGFDPARLFARRRSWAEVEVDGIARQIFELEQ
jgi:hypothetical protein